MSWPAQLLSVAQSVTLEFHSGDWLLSQTKLHTLKWGPHFSNYVASYLQDELALESIRVSLQFVVNLCSAHRNHQLIIWWLKSIFILYHVCKQTFVSSECLTPISLFSLLCFALMQTAATAVDSIQELVMRYLQPEPSIWLCLWFLVRTVHHWAVKSEAHNRSLKEQWVLSAPIPLAGSLPSLPSWPSSLQSLLRVTEAIR